MHPHVKLIAEAVWQAGGEAYLVGGSVRAQVMGCEPKDVDLMVTRLDVARLVDCLPGKKDMVGKSFGVVKVNIDGHIIDVALPRTERSTGVGHKDFAIVADPYMRIPDDLARRDFTMNAIAFDLRTEAYIDPFHGTRDIQSGCIRAVGDPAERFQEDPLRMLRAVRFQSTLGFIIHSHTFEGIIQSSHLLATVSPERIGDEVSRLLMGSHAVQAIRVMRVSGLLEQVLPEWSASNGFEQHNRYHAYTVDEHVLKALSYAVERGASLRARWAVFLHDIAKPHCFTLDEHSHGHFYEHEVEGAIMAVKILQRLRLPNEMVSDVAKIIGAHLKPEPISTDKTLRRYVASMEHLVEDGLMCRESDLYAHADPWPHNARGVIDTIRERIVSLNAIRGFGQAQLALHGGEIAREFGVAGAEIGRLKQLATQAVIDGIIPNEHDAILRWLHGGDI